MAIKVMIVDDDKITRQSLACLIEEESNMNVIGEAENGECAFDLSKKLQPDVILMDVQMEKSNGIEASFKIKEVYPEMKIIALSVYANKNYILGMIKAGVSGYVLKDYAFEELIKAINCVVNGKQFLSQKISENIFEYLKFEKDEDSSTVKRLTKREFEVLKMIADGYSSMQIALHFNVSEKTISTHKANLMDKLAIYSIAGLTKFAIKNKLIQIDS